MYTLLHRQEESLHGKLRYDQTAFVNASTIDASTLSHDPTTLDNYSSNSKLEGRAHGHNQARDCDNAASVLSYNSARDIHNSVKELHGR